MTMEVKDLSIGKGKVDIVLEIVELAEPRTFDKFGKPGRVATARGKDDTGEVKLTLWNEQIDEVNVGDKIKITNGYVSEWQGQKQLSTGRFGKMEVVNKSDKPEAQKPVEKEEPVDEKAEYSDEDLKGEEIEDD